MRKPLSLVLILCLALSLSVPALAAAPPDMQGHRSAGAVDRWMGYGIVEGDGSGFGPDRSMTRAEAATVFDRLFGLSSADGTPRFGDVPPDAWYAESIGKVSAAGIMDGVAEGVADPEGTVTGEQFLVMLARGLGIPELPNNGHAPPSGAEWSRGYLGALAERGYLPDGGAGMLGDVGRGDVMDLMDRTIRTYANEPGATVEVSGSGLVLVAADNVTVTGSADDVSISSSGSVTLDGAVISGSVSVTGGAAVLLEGGTTAANINVTAAADGARITVGEGAKVTGTVATAAVGSSITVHGEAGAVTASAAAEGTKLEIAEGGKVETVSTAAKDSKIAVQGKAGTVTAGTEAQGAKVEVAAAATVGTLNTGAPGGTVTVSGTVGSINVMESAANTAVATTENAKIEKVNTAAPGVSLEGGGDVGKVNVLGDNTSVSVKGAEVAVAAGVTGTTASGKAVAAGTGSVDAEATDALATAGTAAKSAGDAVAVELTAGTGNETGSAEASDDGPKNSGSAPAESAAGSGGSSESGSNFESGGSDTGESGSGDTGESGPGDTGESGSGDTGKSDPSDTGESGSGGAGESNSGDTGESGSGGTGESSPGGGSSTEEPSPDLPVALDTVIADKLGTTPLCIESGKSDIFIRTTSGETALKAVETVFSTLEEISRTGKIQSPENFAAAMIEKFSELGLSSDDIADGDASSFYGAFSGYGFSPPTDPDEYILAALDGFSVPVSDAGNVPITTYYFHFTGPREILIQTNDGKNALETVSEVFDALRDVPGIQPATFVDAMKLLFHTLIDDDGIGDGSIDSIYDAIDNELSLSAPFSSGNYSDEYILNALNNFQITLINQDPDTKITVYKLTVTLT